MRGCCFDLHCFICFLFRFLRFWSYRLQSILYAQIAIIWKDILRWDGRFRDWHWFWLFGRLWFFQDNLSEFDYNFLLQFSLLFVHVSRQRIRYLIFIEIESKNTFFELPEVSDFQAIPRMDRWLIRHFCGILLQCNHIQIHLSLIFIVCSLKVIVD